VHIDPGCFYTTLNFADNDDYDDDNDVLHYLKALINHNTNRQNHSNPSAATITLIFFLAAMVPMDVGQP